MTAFLEYALLGLGAGAVYSLLAQGIVLAYRGSGILNFAHGAMAMLAVYIYVGLTQSGWAPALAAVVAIALLTILGALVYVVILRRLREASPLARTAATLGVLAIIQASVVIVWGSTTRSAPSLLPQTAVSIGSIVVGSDRLIMIGIGLIAALALAAYFRFARPGLATSAVAENELAASTLGWSPNVIAAANWAAAGALAAAAGIIVAPIIGVDPTTLSALVIVAMAAALAGGFRSFILTFIGGLAIGVVQSELLTHVSVVGVGQSVPLIAIVGLLMLRGKSLPSRSHLTDRLPMLGSGRVRPAVFVPAVVVVALLLLYVLPTDWSAAVGVSLISAIVMLSVVVLTGYAGQMSLAQYSFAGLAALASGRLVASLHWPFELALVAGVLAVIPFGLLFALPALRTRGISLAVVTLALGVAVQALIFNNQTIAGGLNGINVGPQTIFGISIDGELAPARYAVFALVCFALTALCVANLRRGRSGRRLIAIRSNERAAAALGVSVFEGKIYAFALAAVIAGFGGILLAFQSYTLLFGSGWDPQTSINATIYTIVGGVGYIAGPVVGSTLTVGGVGSQIAQTVVPNADSYLPLVGGISVLVILLQDPDGSASATLKMLKALAARVRPPRPSDSTAHLGVSGEETPHRVSPATLRVRDLTVRFGGVVAVDQVSLEVESGSVTALIGPNGAGKTTVVDALTGFVRPTSGSIDLDEHLIGSLPAHRRARLGLSRSFQGLELFEDISVLDNLRVAGDARDRRAYLTDLVWPGDPPLTPVGISAVHHFKLAPYLDRMPPNLPHGPRKLVSIARAVAMGSSILMLDEPAAGLDTHERDELADLLRGLANEWNIGILLIEHDMAFVMSVSDRVVVMDYGKKIADGIPSVVTADPTVIAAYLGEPTKPDPAVAASVVPALTLKLGHDNNVQDRRT